MGMFGTGIKLSRRINNKDEKEPLKRKCIFVEPEFGIRSNYCNRYSFRWARPPQKESETDNCLTVTTIQLPSNIESFNTGSSLKKWSCKKSLLKSHKRILSLSRPESKCNLKIPPEHISFYENHLLECNEDIENELMPRINDLEHRDSVAADSIDEDVKRLCDLINNSGIDEDETDRKIKAWRKNNRKSAKKRRGSIKTMSMTLSKPESPQTEQVIRVDIVSNIFLDIGSSENTSSCQNINEDVHNVEEIKDDLFLQCQKMELSNR